LVWFAAVESFSSLGIFLSKQKQFILSGIWGESGAELGRSSQPEAN